MERLSDTSPAETTKRCARCGGVKPLDDFYRNNRSKDQHGAWCKSCYSELQLSEDRLERKKAASHERYLRLGDEIRRYNRERHHQMKALLVAHYSNGANRCACCGESNIHFLTIDHINGNGSQHRKSSKCGTGATFYRWLLREGMPKGYQALCYNCNSARAWQRTCPHKLGKKHEYFKN